MELPKKKWTADNKTIGTRAHMIADMDLNTEVLALRRLAVEWPELFEHTADNKMTDTKAHMTVGRLPDTEQ